jgi:hypothetical protein
LEIGDCFGRDAEGFARVGIHFASEEDVRRRVEGFEQSGDGLDVNGREADLSGEDAGSGSRKNATPATDDLSRQPEHRRRLPPAPHKGDDVARNDLQCFRKFHETKSSPPRHKDSKEHKENFVKLCVIVSLW